MYTGVPLYHIIMLSCVVHFCMYISYRPIYYYIIHNNLQPKHVTVVLTPPTFKLGLDALLTF